MADRIERYGTRTFSPQISFDPAHRPVADADLSEDGDTGEFQLCIKLGTKSGKKALAKARNLMRLLQLAERR